MRGQALHPINPVLAYRRCMCRLSLPAQCRAMRAGTAWEYGVHDDFGTIFNLVEPAPIEQVLRRKRLRGRSESGIVRHGPAVTANAYPASHTLHTHSIDS